MNDTVKSTHSNQSVGFSIGGEGLVDVTIAINGPSGAFGFQPHGTAQIEYFSPYDGKVIRQTVVIGGGYQPTTVTVTTGSLYKGEEFVGQINITPKDSPNLAPGIPFTLSGHVANIVKGVFGVPSYSIAVLPTLVNSQHPLGGGLNRGADNPPGYLEQINPNRNGDANKLLRDQPPPTTPKKTAPSPTISPAGPLVPKETPAGTKYVNPGSTYVPPGSAPPPAPKAVMPPSVTWQAMANPGAPSGRGGTALQPGDKGNLQPTTRDSARDREAERRAGGGSGSGNSGGSDNGSGGRDVFGQFQRQPGRHLGQFGAYRGQCHLWRIDGRWQPGRQFRQRAGPRHQPHRLCPAHPPRPWRRWL